MDELFEKTQALLKSLLSMKTMKPKDAVPALKAPSLKAPSIKPPSVGKIPGLPPPSKKDPVKVAQQLKNPNPGKVNVEVLKVEKNGQWSLEKAAPLHEISFTHQHHDLGGDGDLTHIKAIHPVHGVVGEAVFEHQPDKSIRLENIDVHPDHQRKGIGSSIVNHAQSLTGKPMLTSTGRTAAGEALWNKVKPPSTPSMLKMDPPEPKFKAGDHVDLGNDPGHTLEVVHSKWNPQSESYQYRLKVHSHPVGKTYGCGHEGESCGAQTNKPESVLVHKK
jgi:GNAT superfamily N-acetyltransferase